MFEFTHSLTFIILTIQIHSCFRTSLPGFHYHFLVFRAEAEADMGQDELDEEEEKADSDEAAEGPAIEEVYLTFYGLKQ